MSPAQAPPTKLPWHDLSFFSVSMTNKNNGASWGKRVLKANPRLQVKSLYVMFYLDTE